MDVRSLLPCTVAELLRRLRRKSYSGLHAVLSGRARCSAELAAAIDRETGGAVPRGLLRPDLWPPEHERAS